jgi:hypothetical protein
MAVFVAASDESAGNNRQDPFILSGWVASENDWSNIFAPAWQKLVLDGPPTIDYLHMVDIRSRQWREDKGLLEADAEKRVDDAIAILSQAQFIYPIGLTVSGSDIQEAFSSVTIRASKRKTSPFEPDYLCFLGYAMLTLEYVHQTHPDCEKVDFIVEKNGKVTDFIRHFHSTLREGFIGQNRRHLADLVGDLLPVSKDRIPAQAADVLCWHTARGRNPSAMSVKDYKRYELLAHRQGTFESLDKDNVYHLARLLLGDPQDGED